MKSLSKYFLGFITALVALGLLTGCDFTPSSDQVQQETQERMLQEGAAQTGMPNIKNFRERKILKDVLELRDQTGLATYTYVENQVAVPVKGGTVKGGKFTYLGESVGYPIPYSTQYTNPEKTVWNSRHPVVLPQADPNGLFSPASSEGTWVLLLTPGTKVTAPVYIESRIMATTFQLPFD